MYNECIEAAYKYYRYTHNIIRTVVYSTDQSKSVRVYMYTCTCMYVRKCIFCSHMHTHVHVHVHVCNVMRSKK